MSRRPFEGVRLARLERTSYACPAAWNLLAEDGRLVWAHFQRGLFCFTIDTHVQKEGWDYALPHGHAFAGHMTDSEMLDLTGFLATPRTEFLPPRN